MKLKKETKATILEIAEILYIVSFYLYLMWAVGSVVSFVLMVGVVFYGIGKYRQGFDNGDAFCKSTTGWTHSV
jgi:hypothetical protein